MNTIELSHLYTVEGYITFSVRVASGDFSGKSGFCINDGSLRNSLQILQSMYDNLSGSCIINDYDSDDYISLEMQQYGHLIIRGQIGGSYHTQFLAYEMLTDQTELKKIIDSFNHLLKAV